MSALEVRRLTAGYGPLAVVHGVDITVGEGEIVALLGRNGAGKSTTLLALGGFLTNVSGVASVNGVPLTGPPDARTRRGLGIVLEGRSVFSSLSVADNLRVGGVPNEAALALFPELEARLKLVAGALSGGEQQMLTLARALGRKPRVLLVDELSFGLAPIVCGRLFAELRAVARQDGMAILLVEQHIENAAEIADRALVMSEGLLRAELPGADLAARADEVERIYLAGVGDAKDAVYSNNGHGPVR